MHISVAAGGDKAFVDFAEMLSQSADVWPATATFCKLVAARLCEDLEPPKSRPFWSVLNRFKAL